MLMLSKKLFQENGNKKACSGQRQLSSRMFLLWLVESVNLGTPRYEELIDISLSDV